MSKLIYLDNNSTTPVDPAVFEKMKPYFTEICGNPSNQHHSAGSRAARAVEEARLQVATAIRAEPQSIVFTSGATESNNLAILGTCRAQNQIGHIVTSAIEHKAVLEPCRHLESIGWKVTYLRPDGQGVVDWQAVDAAITPETTLVSIMAANNEVGTIQEVERIGHICSRHGVIFHCDASQALGRMAINVDEWQVDLMSLSGHKAYGPKGAGVLYIREGRKAESLTPICFGGGQESGVRPGTLPVPSIVGLGMACTLASHQLERDANRLHSLRRDLLEQLMRSCPNMVVHGHPAQFLPGLLSVAFPGVDGDEFLFALQNVAISQGSACTAGSSEPSHVLTALGVSYELANCSFRFGIGRFTTPEDITAAAAEVARVLDILR